MKPRCPVCRQQLQLVFPDLPLEYILAEPSELCMSSQEMAHLQQRVSDWKAVVSDIYILCITDIQGLRCFGCW